MTFSKNLFFSEDEIEAVDMEIETLLLARKRQDSGQKCPTPPVTLDVLKPSEPAPVASRPPSEVQASVVSFPAIPKSSGVLPPQRLTKTGDLKERQAFRIEHGGDAQLWPEPERRTIPQRAARNVRSSPLRRRLVCGGTAAILLATVVIALMIWSS